MTIEIPRGCFIKYRGVGTDTGIDFVSPLPCPFNYGFVAGITGGDGMPLDALVLGPRLARGTTIPCQVQGVALFTDAAQEDSKLICGSRPISTIEAWLLTASFHVYARMKQVINFIKRQHGPTAFMGLKLCIDSAAPDHDSRGNQNNR